MRRSVTTTNPPLRQEASSARRIGHLRTLVRIYQHPSAILLFVQLAGLLLYPFIENMPAGHLLLGAFGILVLCLSIAMVHRTAGRVWISAAIAIAVVALKTPSAMLGWDALVAWEAALEALFYFYAAWCLITYMLADQRATTDELYAAGATFTLLAWAFTHLFVLCQALQPGCFSAGNPDQVRSWTELLFLSFVLLSSTGIGEIIPATNQARALASLEIFVGIMYLALIVSRLIGLTLLSRERHS